MVAEIDLDTFRKSSRLFELLDDAGRQRLLAGGEAVAYVAGETVVREGEPGDAMYVIRSGRVAVVVEAVDGERQVAELGPGSVFGEMAVVMGEPRSATVVAREPVEAWRFSKELVDALLADYPALRQVLAKLSVRRSEETLERMLADDASGPEEGDETEQAQAGEDAHAGFESDSPDGSGDPD